MYGEFVEIIFAMFHVRNRMLGGTLGSTDVVAYENGCVSVGICRTLVSSVVGFAFHGERHIQLYY